MDTYMGFAYVYDQFMDNVPYEEWSNYLNMLLQEQGIIGGLIAELGCGTGNMTEYLAAAGYDMVGIDFSEEMLAIAQQKKEKSNHDILYLQQDMREFELLYFRRKGSITGFSAGKQLFGDRRCLYL